jgi:hypothetical protein
MRRPLGVALIVVGVASCWWWWLAPTRVTYPFTDLGEGGFAHSRSCGAPITHAWGYSTPDGWVGWNHSVGNPDYRACLDQSLQGTVVGTGVLTVGVVGGLLLVRRRRLAVTRENSLDWRAMDDLA